MDDESGREWSPDVEDACQPTTSYFGVQDTIREIRRRIQSHDVDRASQRVVDAIVRGATAGIGLRGGLHLVAFILQLLFPRKNRRRKEVVFRDMVTETLRYGLFLGSFSGVFVGADEMIACLFGRRRTNAWRGLVSGLLAGPTLLLTGPGQTHTSLGLYLFLRGMTLLIRCGNLPTARPWLRRLLAPTRWKHGDVVLMCLSTAQLGYSWIIRPSTLPSSYIRFLNRHGGKDPVLLEGVREMCTRKFGARGTLATLKNTRFKNADVSIPCEILHPGRSCAQHSVAFFPEAYVRALPVYIPVYVIPAGLVHRHRLLHSKTAPVLWRKVALGCLRSSLFLSLYCTLAWRGACTGFQTTQGVSGRIVALSCWVAGLAILVEKPSRRMELTLYCTSRALESFALCLKEWGYVRPGIVPRRIDVVLFTVASAAICHCYEDHFGRRRDVFAGKYLTVFDFIFGNTGFEDAVIRHVPSNIQLVQGLGSRVRSAAKSLTDIASFVSDDTDSDPSHHDDIESHDDPPGNGKNTP